MLKYIHMRTSKAKVTLVTIVLAALVAYLLHRPAPEQRSIGTSGEAMMIVLLDGTLVRPSEETPLSESQKRISCGNAFLAKTKDGTVCLVTAGHVAKHLPNSGSHYRCGSDIAVINLWEPGKFPDAEKLPEFADYDRRSPVTFVAWNLPTNRAARIQGTFDRTAQEDRWPGQIMATPPTSGDDALPGSSGSPVFQDGKVVGVLVGGHKLAAKYDYSVRNGHIRFQPFSEKR